MLMRDLSDREHELADLKAVLQERDTTLAETNQVMSNCVAHTSL